MLSPEQNKQIFEMYTHRVSLMREAGELTIDKIADKMKVGKNTVWARVNGMLADKHEAPDSYTERLEAQLHAFETQASVFEARIRGLEEIILEAKRGLHAVAGSLRHQTRNIMPARTVKSK